jgi:hypothetical protein
MPPSLDRRPLLAGDANAMLSKDRSVGPAMSLVLDLCCKAAVID